MGLMIVSTAGVIGLLLAYRGPEKAAAPYVRMAIDAAKVGNYENVVRAYAQAFARTKEPVWLVAQGQAAREMGDAGTALRAWDRAITEDPGLLAAHESRVRLRLELVGVPMSGQQGATRRHVNLRNAAEALLQQKADHPLGIFALGIALTGLEHEDPNNMDLGIEKIEKAHELSPADEDIAESLARVYEITALNLRREKKLEEAEEYRKKAEDVYREMTKADPESAEAYLSHAVFLMRRFQMDMRLALFEGKTLSEKRKQASLDEIDRLLTEAEKRAPDMPELGMERAQYWRLVGDPEKVVETLESITNKVPEYLPAYRELASQLLSLKRWEDGIKVLQKGLDQDVDLLGYKGVANKQRRFRLFCLASEACLAQASSAGKREEREKHLQRAEEFYNQAVAERGGTNWLTQQLAGQLREAQGEYREAQRAYEAADAALDWRPREARYKIQNLLRLSQLYIQHLRAPGEAVRLLNTVLERNRTNPRARILRAEAYLLMDKAAEAVDDAKVVLSSSKEQDEESALVRQAKLVAMRGYSRLGKVDQVASLQKDLGVDDSLASKLRQAAVLQMQKKEDEAAKIYKEILKDEPANPPVLKGAVRFFLAMDKKDEAKKLIDAARKAKPDDASIKALDLLLEEDLDEEERSKRILGILKETESPLAREIGLYQFYFRKGEAEKALEHLAAAREEKPENTELLEHEFSLCLQLKDWDRAKKVWDQAVNLDADGAGGRFYKGRISLRQAELESQQARQAGEEDLAKAREHREKAREFYKDAAEQFREGIRLYSKSAMAYTWLGAAEEGLGNIVDARDAYLAAVDIDPTNGAAHRLLAKLGRQYGNVADVEGHLEEAIRLAPKDAEGLPVDQWLRFQVESQQEQEDPRAAIKQREATRKKKPDDIYNLMRLALLYERIKSFDKADECVSQALKAEPENMTLAWDASRYYRRRKQFDKAEEILRDQVKAAGEEEKWRAQAMVARHFVAVRGILMREQPIPVPEVVKAIENADRAYAVAIRLPKAPATVYAEAATFCQATNRRRAALDWLRKGLALVKEKSYESQLRRRIIRLLLSTRPLPVDAQKEVTDYVRNFPEDPVGLLFRAELLAAQGKLDAAIEEHTAYLDQITRQSRGPSRSPRMAEGHYLRGQLYLRQARSSPAVRDELLRLAVRDLAHAKAIAPDGFRNQMHRVLLARAYEMMGEPQQAVTELRSVLEKDPKARSAARELVRLYARQKRWADQEALIRQQMNVFPDEWGWPYLLGTQFIERDRAADAVEHLRQACELLKWNTKEEAGANQAAEALLNALTLSGRYGQVVSVVEKNLSPEGRSSAITAYYAGALAKTGKVPQSLEQFEKAVTASPSWKDYSSVSREMGRALGIKEAVKLLGERVKEQGDKGTVSTLLLSSMLALDGQNEQALWSISQAVTMAKEPALKGLALTTQGILLYDLGKHEEAVKAYQEALRVKGDDLTVLNNLAYTLAEDLNRPKEALPYAERAHQLSPADAFVLDTLGWCLFLMNRTEDALGVLQESIDRDPELLDPRLHLARLNAKVGRKEQAKSQLQDMLETAEKQGNKAHVSRIQAVMTELGIQA